MRRNSSRRGKIFKDSPSLSKDCFKVWVLVNHSGVLVLLLTFLSGMSNTFAGTTDSFEVRNESKNRPDLVVGRMTADKFDSGDKAS